METNMFKGRGVCVARAVGMDVSREGQIGATLDGAHPLRSPSLSSIPPPFAPLFPSSTPPSSAPNLLSLRQIGLGVRLI